MVTASWLIRPPSACLERFLRRLGGDEGVAAGADEIGAAGFLQGLADLEVFLRLEELQQRPLQLAVAEMLRHVYRLLRERIDPSVVHAGGHVAAAANEVGHRHYLSIGSARLAGCWSPNQRFQVLYIPFVAGH